MTTDLITMESPDDPERCQGLQGGNSQCHYKAMPGYKFCKIHGGAALAVAAKKSVRDYMLQTWRDRVDAFADSDGITSLRGEIGIARVALEKVINSCKTEVDVVIHSDKIMRMVTTISQVVEKCFKLERDTGFLMDKTKVGIICDGIVNVLTNHIKDPDLLRVISLEILESVMNNAG